MWRHHVFRNSTSEILDSPDLGPYDLGKLQKLNKMKLGTHLTRNGSKMKGSYRAEMGAPREEKLTQICRR